MYILYDESESCMMLCGMLMYILYDEIESCMILCDG